MQAAHQPAQGEVIRGCLVVQPLQHNRGGRNGSRVGSRYLLQLGPLDRSSPEIAFGYMMMQIGKVLSEIVCQGAGSRTVGQGVICSLASKKQFRRQGAF